MTYLLYSRLSKDPTLDAEAIERQMADNERLAKSLGWTDFEHLVDRDRSAWKKNGKRPAFKQLLEAIETRVCSGVIVWNIDRLLRRNDELEMLISMLEKHPVEIHTAAGQIDLSTADGRLLARLLVSVAAKESDDKSRRIKRALEGKDMSGSIFGELPGEREGLNRIVEMYLAGDSLGKISRTLNAEGVPTRRNGRWTRNTVLRIVGYDRLSALVDKPTFLAVQKEREARAAIPTRKYESSNHDYILTGILRCAECGKGMQSTQTSAGRLGYICLRAIGGCGLCASPAQTIEQVVVDYVRSNLRLDQQYEESTGKPALPAERIAQLEELDEDYYVRRTLDKERYERMYAQIKELALSEATPVVRRMVPVGKLFADEFDKATLARKRELLSRVIESVTVKRGIRGPKGFDPARLEIQIRT